MAVEKPRSNYRKCTECGTVIQWYPNIDTGFFGNKFETVWDSAKPIRSVRCQRCNTHLYSGVERDKPEYCKTCDQFVMTYSCCPKCGCRNVKTLGLFD